MRHRKLFNLIAALAVIASLLVTSGGAVLAERPQRSTEAPRATVNAAPASPVDETKVPHYFGPFPNWANSPFTLADVAVEIQGNGSGATATAEVGANGAITAINVVTPGSGYTTATVVITGAGNGAAATATITGSGAVTAVNVTASGAGYKAPVVTISGGGATTSATATAYGGVTSLKLTNPGTGYTFPTVDFDMPDDPAGTIARGHVTWDSTTGAITAIVIDDPGSGYASAPNVVIHDGTQFDPINRAAKAGAAVRQEYMTALNEGRAPRITKSESNAPAAGAGATAVATINVVYVIVDTYGAGYTANPTVTISDSNGGTGSGATATAVTDLGAVTGITVTNPGSGYVTGSGIKKFVDNLPGLCMPPACPADPAAKFIPLGVADTAKYAGADTYEIALVQYRTSFSSSLPPTLVRGYVQLETPANAAVSQHFPLYNEMLDGSRVPLLKPNGSPYLGVTSPQYLGPTLAATKNKPVRIVFRNLLPTGAPGDLFLPTDTTLMGSGMGPMNMMPPADAGTVLDAVRNPTCTDYPQTVDGMGMGMCFKQNRATLHLHGGNTPWISDGTTHQWTTPANEMTPWPQGVSVGNVPDMAAEGCADATDGCLTFYYTNQQSARLLFYHDHAWGITRLNVYAGEAAGYLITDPTEQKLLADGTIPSEQIPLVVQDKTFVPQTDQLKAQDPTWNAAAWGGYGSLWYHHVYMPAQNPGDPSGMSAYGRWMYGPWFWPPATPPHGPIANPYFGKDPKGPDGIRGTADDFSTALAKPCSLDDPTSWQYDTDPFCEPAEIPGTPNISVGMEQFNDTPVVNGVAYPTLTLEPKSYRFRVLNAANDRFFNFQWYVADPSTASASRNAKGEVIGGTEVAFKPAELEAAQTDPNIFPTPDESVSPAGPKWIQIGTEGGFLPAPNVVPNQPITWITDPTRFDVGNVDLHALVLAPAERADVIVDFSQYAGKTLILYNDAPAAYPARVSSYDYYTGAPDLSPVGAPKILPGYGPNTRTVMQVKIAANAPAPAFNLNALNKAFSHKADGSGVFESGQHPIIVGQAAYNSAYGQSFATAGDCTATPVNSTQKCDGMARINQQGYDQFTFDTLRMKSDGTYPSGFSKVQVPLQPKGIHDEMNASSFDEFGRMQANLGIEAVPATPGLQNITLYPFVNPATEIIDGTNLPKGFDLATSQDIKVSVISTGADGTQIWKITHNGVDTHPIHWHLYDVQLLNRVTWDNIVIPPDPGELGWKDTLRVSPLEDTIVALRPVVPQVPFEVPNAIRELNPMMPAGDQTMFNNVDGQGNPTTPIVNQLINFGWEYVYHCHILSHEEMDMMRPVTLALPPNKPTGLAVTVNGSGGSATLTLNWNDNSITETSFVVQRDATGTGNGFVDIATIQSPLDQPNTHGTRSYTDTTYGQAGAALYRVVAKNTVGYGQEFPALTVQSVSDPVSAAQVPNPPTNLTAVLKAGPSVLLGWIDNATNETGFVIERATNGGAFAQLTTVNALPGTGIVSFTDTTVVVGNYYDYRVAAVNGFTKSAYSNTVRVYVTVPNAPNDVRATAVRVGTQERVAITWSDTSNNENGFTVERATNATFTQGRVSVNVPANVTAYQTGNIPRANYYFRVRSFNDLGASAWQTAQPFPVRAP